jgi:CubicO group peptidase (beta-lactamase class C family)
LDEIPGRIQALKRYGKPIVCNEDDKLGEEAARAARLSVENGASWGLMLQQHNQRFPFAFDGAEDDPVVYAELKSLTSPSDSDRLGRTDDYFPFPDADGGWRTLSNADDVRRVAGLDVQALDRAFEFIQGSTENGGLLVVRRGWLAYERYFGQGHREAAPNLASCGKSVTSVAIGMLMAERRDLFPDGLDQKVFAAEYFPAEAFPLADPRMHDITLGQLLAFTAGVRGNNPCYVNGQEVAIDPTGPDGWPAMVDAAAFGKPATPGSPTPATASLWCEPGGGYSYATSSIHLASVMLRHITGQELQQYVADHLAEPLGYRAARDRHGSLRLPAAPGGPLGRPAACPRRLCPPLCTGVAIQSPLPLQPAVQRQHAR